MATYLGAAVNLDRASKEELKSLRDVGEARSVRIIAARDKLGGLTRAFLFDWEDFPPNFWRSKFENGEVTNDEPYEQLEEPFEVHEDPLDHNDDDLQNNLNVPVEDKASNDVTEVESPPDRAHHNPDRFASLFQHLLTTMQEMDRSIKDEGKALLDLHRSIKEEGRATRESLMNLAGSIRNEGETTRKAMQTNAFLPRAEFRFTENNCSEGNLASQNLAARPKDRVQDFALPPPLKSDPDERKRGPPVNQKLMDTISARQMQGPPAWGNGLGGRNALHQEAPHSPQPLRAPRRQQPEAPAPLQAVRGPLPRADVQPRQPKPKMPTFTGKPGDALDWTAFIVQFERIAQRQQWEDETKLDRLIECLQDQAAHFFSRLPLAHRNQYEPLRDRLRLRFAPVEPPAVLRKKLQDAKQGPDESLQEFASRVQQQALDAHPTLPLDAIEPMAVDVFLAGCREKLAALNSLNRDPQTMEQALTQVMAAVANQHAVFGPTPVSKLRQVIRFEEPVDSPYEVRAIQTLSERSVVSEKKQSGVEKEVALLRTDVSTLCAEMREMLAALRGAPPRGEPSLQRGRQLRSRSPSPLPRDPDRPYHCFNCKAPGHFSRECPQKSMGRERSRSPSPAAGKEFGS